MVETQLKRALVADDERAMARFVEVNLQKAGWEVTTVFDGKAALNQIEQGEFDLFVLDITMPFANGLEILKLIRKNPATQAAQVILLTAEEGSDNVDKGYQEGADVYLTKPVAAQELMRVVNHN